MQLALMDEKKKESEERMSSSEDPLNDRVQFICALLNEKHLTMSRHHIMLKC